MRLVELFNKRLLGYLSWQWLRKKRHRPETLSVVAEKARLDGDHLIVTGDLTQTGLPDECRQAQQWLKTLGEADQVSVIPGNHDVYTSVNEAGVGLWQPWMQSDPGWPVGTKSDTDPDFPFVRKRGSVVFLGVSSAIVTPLFCAYGRIGGTQLRRLESLLAETKGCFRVLLTHHSPVARADSVRRRLANAADVRSLLARQGAELILHGHNHATSWGAVPGSAGDIPVIGVPSASATGALSKKTDLSRAGYHAYEVACQNGQWQLQVDCYRLNPTGLDMVLDDQRHYRLSA